MLTKKDLEQIDLLLQKRLDDAIGVKIKPLVDESINTAIEGKVKPIIDKAFEQFYDHFFEPHVTKSDLHQERSELQHLEIVREIKKLQEREGNQDDYLKEHDLRIENLEKAMKLKN